MTGERILPQSWEELKEELGPRIGAFELLLEEALRYFDTLLAQDGKSSPGIERELLERFLTLVKEEHFLTPRFPREALIKLAYGLVMARRETPPAL